MGTPLRVLIVEDSEDDAILVLRELRRGGYDPTFERVDTPQAMNAALEQQTWDIVLSDYAMPRFSMPAALAMVKEKGLDLPFIIVSGAIGEEAAVAAMRAGAHDYVMKNNLARLIPAVERELREAETRRERKQVEKTLYESEEKFKRFVEEMNDGYCVLQASRIVFANARSAEMFGYAQGEVIGKTLQELLPPEIVKGLVEVHARRRRGESVPPQYETTLARKNGTARWVEFGARLIEYGGKPATSVVIRDITDRKRTEEALRESEEHYSALVGNLTDAVFKVKGGVVTWCNDKVEQIYGYPEDELLGKSASFFYPSDISPTEFTGRVAAAIKERGFFRSTSKFQKKDGSLVDIEYSLSQIPGKAPIEIIAVARDVTERKLVEEALRESEEKYRTILEDIEDGYYEVDTAGNFTFFNPPMCGLIGYSKDEMMGMNNRQYMDKENAKKVYQAFNRVYTTGKHTKEFGWEIIRKDGTKRFVEASVSVKRNSEGEPIGFRGIVRDITERKLVEEALRRSEEYFRSLTENISDVVIVLGSDGTIRYQSPSFKRMLGEQRSGKDLFEFVHPDDMANATETFAELMQNPGATVYREIRGQHRDGSWRTFEVVGRNLLDNPAVGGIVVTFRDITERKQAEEERQRMEQQLQLAGRLAAVGELAAGIAHELNNPLTAVQAFAQFLADRDNLDESVKSDVETIYREAQRASRITTSLLRFARRNRPDKRLISINEVVERALELHAYRMKLSNIEVLVELAPDLPMTMADSDQMHQVFVNIITNAEQAMTEAHSKGKLRIKTQRVDEMVQAAFADDGPGIPEDNLKSIFDPFFTTKEVGSGTGLGLSTCYGIVREHGGHMYARSKPGEGATLVVEIPIVSEDQPIAEQADSTEIQKA